MRFGIFPVKIKSPEGTGAHDCQPLPKGQSLVKGLTEMETVEESEKEKKEK